MTDTTNRDATRRQFLLTTGALAAVTMTPGTGAAPTRRVPMSPMPQQAPPDDVELPELTLDTLREAQKLTGVEFTDEELAAILEGIDDDIAGFKRRMRHELSNDIAPAQTFDPRRPGVHYPAQRQMFVGSHEEVGEPPASDEDLAFAPVTSLSRWIQRKQLTSEELTQLYLERLKTHGPALECVITLTEDLAMEQAKRADRDIARGRYRGPLHGIPWGAKDLLDTAGIRTTWGAMPYKERVAKADAAVVKRLQEAGAVLVAKLTLGALAYGDIWFDGRTNNPFNTEQGSSGSSAGSAAATAAGLVGFAIGTETLGSIVSPCMRCGTTGLRPTFGRVPRTGAMALCWSLDKIGPICRTVEDTILVLDAINGSDPGDPSSLDVALNFNARKPIGPLRMGYDTSWFEPAENERFAETRDIEINALEVMKSLGVRPVELDLPDLPYGAMMTILGVEAAAAFEELTLTNKDDAMKWQSRRAWPNSFRQTRFTPAIEYVQAERIRRQAIEAMADQFGKIDFIFGPSYAGSMLLITNNTGHPSLTIRAGFRENGTPHGVTLIGNLFDEGTICRVGMEMEKKLGVWDRRPDLT